MTPADGGAAFPFAAEYGHPAACGGMSLRDWFAGQALIGLCARPQCGTIGNRSAGDVQRTAVLAEEAYAAADAMLGERAARQDPAK